MHVPGPAGFAAAQAMLLNGIGEFAFSIFVHGSNMGLVRRNCYLPDKLASPEPAGWMQVGTTAVGRAILNCVDRLFAE